MTAAVGQFVIRRWVEENCTVAKCALITGVPERICQRRMESEDRRDYIKG